MKEKYISSRMFHFRLHFLSCFRFYTSHEIIFVAICLSTGFSQISVGSLVTKLISKVHSNMHFIQKIMKSLFKRSCFVSTRSGRPARSKPDLEN